MRPAACSMPYKIKEGIHNVVPSFYMSVYGYFSKRMRASTAVT